MIFRLFHAVILKASKKHIGKTYQANDARKEGPVTENHKNSSNCFSPNIPKSPQNGQLAQWIAHEGGFSLMEVIIASSIMAVMAYFGMELMDNMKRNQAGTEKRFQVFSLWQEMQSLLGHSKSCEATFKEVDFKKLYNQIEKSSESDSPISHLIKVYNLNDKEKTEKEVKRFQIYNKEDPQMYGGVKIDQYQIVKKDEDFFSDESSEVGLTLRVHFNLGSGVYGPPIIKKEIPLKFLFDPNEPFKFLSCHNSSLSSSTTSFTILDPTLEKNIEGKTGEDACQDKGLTCQHVKSLNYASKVYGQEALSNLCLINYNTKLKNVRQGSPISNIHSCKSTLGIFDTYKLDKKNLGVTCQGIFMAHCK